ncbi:MAG: hypothetical protein ACOCUH_04555, partial [Bacteriovoracia bacterium]
YQHKSFDRRAKPEETPAQMPFCPPDKVFQNYMIHHHIDDVENEDAITKLATSKPDHSEDYVKPKFDKLPNDKKRYVLWAAVVVVITVVSFWIGSNFLGPGPSRSPAVTKTQKTTPPSSKTIPSRPVPDRPSPRVRPRKVVNRNTVKKRPTNRRKPNAIKRRRPTRAVVTKPPRNRSPEPVDYRNQHNDFERTREEAPTPSWLDNRGPDTDSYADNPGPTEQEILAEIDEEIAQELDQIADEPERYIDEDMPEELGDVLNP